MGFRGIIGVLSFSLVVLFLASLLFGRSSIGLQEIYLNPSDHNTAQILWHFRLPRSLNAIFAGLALPVSGFLLQALFRNPLAGPSVFGLTSAAGLGVALLIFLAVPFGLGYWVNSSLAFIVAAALGAFGATLVISFLAVKVKGNASLIIAGFMIAGFASALVALLQYYSSDSEMRRFLVWNYGSLTAVDYPRLGIYFFVCLLGMGLGLYSLKHLLAMQLGEEYAFSLGVKSNKTRLWVLISASLLTAAATCFAGPIAFVGLAIPHLARMVLKNGSFRQHFWLTLLLGPVVMLFTLLISLSFSDKIIPINIILSLVGAPLLIYIVLKNKEI